MHVRVYNYNTMERVHKFEAHSDYLRCLAAHPTQPYLLSSSDDMSIKLWDWDKKWQNVQTFEGHGHYVMQIVVNPKDNNQFASASLDKTVKVSEQRRERPRRRPNTTTLHCTLAGLFTVLSTCMSRGYNLGVEN